MLVLSSCLSSLHSVMWACCMLAACWVVIVLSGWSAACIIFHWNNSQLTLLRESYVLVSLCCIVLSPVQYTNIDWCRGQQPEGNIAQLMGIIFQCWSRLTVNICFFYITEKKKKLPHSALSLTGIFKLVIPNEKHVFQFFANDYIFFAFLNSLKYVKYKRKRLFKPF